MKSVFVTGGNSGIGLALCKQLASEDGCYVFMGSRSLERGQKALADISAGIEDKIEVVQCDISDAASVAAAAQSVKEKLSDPLYAVVNNAGCGLAHGVSADSINDTNFYGTTCVVNAFLPLLQQEGGRIVNVGSGAGPMWLAKQDEETQRLLTSGTLDSDGIHQFMSVNRNQDPRHAYGISKCLLSVYTEWLAKANPSIVCTSITPGFIDTAIVAGFGATKKPEEGTVSIRHCLFQELAGNGFFYGSDAVRSPFYPSRNPGEAEFTGEYPWQAS
jgi:NAD(P)-dependent dehydrogenase (short-subunit alcohol dehydrogenase family)